MAIVTIRRKTVIIVLSIVLAIITVAATAATVITATRAENGMAILIDGGDGLLPPFTSVHGLGEAAAVDTVEKREGKEFLSVEEFSDCCNKLSKTHIDQLRTLGAFAGLPETSQLTLF